MTMRKKIHAMFAQYEITEPEVMLLRREMKKAAKKFGWDKSIVYTVAKEVIWSVSDGAFAGLLQTRFQRFVNAMKIVNDGEWTTPDHFMELLDKQHEEHEIGKQKANHLPIHPSVLAGIVKVFKTTVIPENVDHFSDVKLKIAEELNNRGIV